MIVTRGKSFASSVAYIPFIVKGAGEFASPFGVYNKIIRNRSKRSPF